MPSNAIDYEAIRNTLSRYCMAIDGKKFDDLYAVFTPDVDANYAIIPDYENKRDWSALVETLKKTLEFVHTQHALSSQTITISEDGKSAEAISYFTASHFGHGRWEGQLLTAWGIYTDGLMVVEGSEGSKGALPGASGVWLVEKRDLSLVNVHGPTGMMEG